MDFRTKTSKSFCKKVPSTIAFNSIVRYNTFRGGIAQLGERLHGMQEVRGSIPLVSTILTARDVRAFSHIFFLR